MGEKVKIKGKIEKGGVGGGGGDEKSEFGLSLHDSNN